MEKLMSILYPDQYVRTVYDIDYKSLYDKGYRGIMFDVDNTLAPYDQVDPEEQLVELFKVLREIGFDIALVSNNNHIRVNNFNKMLGVHAYPRANKPFTKNLIHAVKTMKTSHDKSVLVGDQLFTDVWAGNQLGCHTILVKPIQDKEQLITKIKRGIESLVLHRYLKKNGYERFK